LEGGLIFLLGGVEGVSERRCRMGFGVAGNYWWQGQNAFSEKQIGRLLDSWTNGQLRTCGQVFGLFFCSPFFVLLFCSPFILAWLFWTGVDFFADVFYRHGDLILFWRIYVPSPEV
jgi:hypothetical protein